MSRRHDNSRVKQSGRGGIEVGSDEQDDIARRIRQSAGTTTGDPSAMNPPRTISRVIQACGIDSEPIDNGQPHSTYGDDMTSRGQISIDSKRRRISSSSSSSPENDRNRPRKSSNIPAIAAMNIQVNEAIPQVDSLRYHEFRQRLHDSEVRTRHSSQPRAEGSPRLAFRPSPSMEGSHRQLSRYPSTHYGDEEEMGHFLPGVVCQTDEGKQISRTALLDNAAGYTFISSKLYAELSPGGVDNLPESEYYAQVASGKLEVIFGPVEITFRFKSVNKKTSTEGILKKAMVIDGLDPEIFFPPSIIERFDLLKYAEKRTLTKKARRLCMLKLVEKSTKEKKEDSERHTDREEANRAAADQEAKERQKQRLLYDAANLEQQARNS